MGSAKSLTARQAELALTQHASRKRQKVNAWFFKTGSGQYGEGDIFIGVSVPEVRLVAKDFETLPFAEIKKLLNSPIHEIRLLAVILLASAYLNGDAVGQDRVYRFYIKNLHQVNNWDLVDASADKIAGAHLFDKKRTPLYVLAASTNIWARRVAMVSTYWMIKRNDFSDTLKLAALFCKDDQDLIHKATGWMLREVGKRSPETLRRFLNAHARQMPRTALRYAIERFEAKERKKYLMIPRVGRS